MIESPAGNESGKEDKGKKKGGKGKEEAREFIFILDVPGDSIQFCAPTRKELLQWAVGISRIFSKSYPEKVLNDQTVS